MLLDWLGLGDFWQFFSPKSMNSMRCNKSVVVLPNNNNNPHGFFLPRSPDQRYAVIRYKISAWGDPKSQPVKLSICINGNPRGPPQWLTVDREKRFIWVNMSICHCLWELTKGKRSSHYLWIHTDMSWLKPGFHGPIWAKHWHVVHPGWCHMWSLKESHSIHIYQLTFCDFDKVVGYNNCAFHLILYILLYYVFHCEWKVDMIQFHELTGLIRWVAKNRQHLGNWSSD